MVSEESREYLGRLRETPAFGATDFPLDGLRQGMGTRRPPADPAVRCLPAEIPGEPTIPAEWVLAPGANPDVRLLYLHGGGFVSGCGAFYLPLAAHLSAAARCAVLLPDYRLAPEDPFPAGLEDCIRAHQWLTLNGPAGPSPARATFIGGDSAGGGLTLSTLLALRDRGLPLPHAAFPLSPFADLTLSGESIRSQAGLDPLASPVFADYRGLPPLLIQVGEFEIIRDDSVTVAGRARAHGVEAVLEVWEGMFHVFQSREPLLPEAREAIEHLAAAIRER